MTMMKNEISDLNKICRACLNPGDLKPFQEYLWLLNKIVNIEIIILDNLPQSMCTNCIKLLEETSAFITTFERSDVHLRETLVEKEQREESILYSYEDRQSSEDEEIEKPVIGLNIEASTIERKRKRGRPCKNKLDDKTFKKPRIEDCSCNICGNKFTRLGGLKRHMKIHMGIKPFKCKVCDKTFVEKATLDRHSLIHSGEKPFECNLCGKSTRRKDQIIEHIQKQHSNATDYNLLITEHERTDNSYIKTDSIKEEIKPKDHSEPDMKPLSDIEMPEPEMTFKTKKRIEICLCNLCGKVFRRRGYLKNHMAIHAKIKPFECNICGKSFTQRHVLTRHNLIHTKERPFQCNLCGKTFTRKEILTEHIKNHDGNKPYLCFHCGKCFTNKDYLAKHLKYYLTGNKSKKNPEEKKCICPHCGKQLHSVSYLKTHLLTHTGEKPFECTICGNKFTVQRTLNHHMNIHKGIKPYQCMQCDKCFRTSSSLKKHGLLHTGERPYKCTSCDKGFIRRSHLKRHFRTHSHKIE